MTGHRCRPSFLRRHRAVLFAMLAGVMAAVIVAAVIVHAADAGSLTYTVG